ncbi:IS2 OrfA, partial [Escherichia coli H296]
MIVLILVFRLVIGEQMIDVLGPEKRRRRTTQEKIAIVQQSFEPGNDGLPCCPATWCGSQ